MLEYDIISTSQSSHSAPAVMIHSKYGSYNKDLSHPFNASIVVAAFIETMDKLHGNLKIIVSNIDPIFTWKYWIKLSSCLGTELAHSSSYHPQSDGKTEIENKCLEVYLHCFVADKQT